MLSLGCKCWTWAVTVSDNVTLWLIWYIESLSLWKTGNTLDLMVLGGLAESVSLGGFMRKVPNEDFMLSLLVSGAHLNPVMLWIPHLNYFHGFHASNLSNLLENVKDSCLSLLGKRILFILRRRRRRRRWRREIL